MKFVPMIGSPPIPIHVVWPIPARVSWLTASYVSVPERDTTPTGPGSVTCAGMIPTFVLLAGEISPGQFGPTSRLPLSWTSATALVMSWTGIPSVMATMRPMPASAASMMAPAAKAGGTYMIEVFAPVSCTARSTVLKIGILVLPSIEVPAALARRHARDNPRAVFRHLPGVEGAVAAGDPLHHQACLVVDEDCHAPC